MKYLIHLRHAKRNSPEPHINTVGISQSRERGKDMKVDYTITSSVERAKQTAVAMGFMVNETSSLLSTNPDEVESEIPWTAKLNEIQIKEGGPTYKFAEEMRLLFEGALSKVDDGQTVLVVSHGGIVEKSLVHLCKGEYDAITFSYVEGYRLKYSNKFEFMDFIRD